LGLTYGIKIKRVKMLNYIPIFSISLPSYYLCNREEALGLVLEEHVVVRSKTDASTKDVLNALTLTSKSIDDRGASGDHGALEKVAEDGEDGSETFRLGHVLGLVGDTGHELSHDDEIGHERSGKERILAGVVDGDGVDATHEDLRGVLIHSTLAVTHIRHVLDDDAVIGLLTGLVEDAVALDDIIDNAGLGDLLGAELSGRAQVLAIVVTKMVVGDDGGDLETGTDEEVSENALDLGLTTLEVITSDVDTVALSKLDDTGDEGVLRRAVDEAVLLEDGCNSEHGGRSDLLLVALDGGEELVSSLVEARADVSKALGGGSPEDDDLLEALLLLEVADIVADVLDQIVVRHLLGENVVSTVLLVGSDEVGEVDGAERLHLGHDGDELTLKVVVENLGALESSTHISTVDIPAADLKIGGLDHGEKIMERNIDFVTVGGHTETHSGALGDGTVEVGLAFARASVPLQTETVGDDTSSHGGTVVATPADQHDTGLGHATLGVEGELGLQVLSDETAVFSLGHTGGVISVVRHDLVRGVAHIGRSNNDGSVNLCELLNLFSREGARSRSIHLRMRTNTRSHCSHDKKKKQ